MSGQGVGSISCSLFVRLVYHITVEAAWRGWGSHTPKSQDGGGGGDHAFSKTKESHSFVKSAEVPLEGWKLESSCRFPTQHTCTCIHTHTHTGVRMWVELHVRVHCKRKKNLSGTPLFLINIQRFFTLFVCSSTQLQIISKQKEQKNVRWLNVVGGAQLNLPQVKTFFLM